MELSELKEKIIIALKQCQSILNSNPNSVLSEADFEKLVCREISNVIKENISHPLKEDFSVHTQVSHYSDENDELNYRIDILLLKEGEIEKCQKCHKKFKYADAAFAIELKYLHEKDSIRKVECDFCKRKHLEINTWLYVVVLIDSNDNEKFNDKKIKIEKMCEDYIKSNSQYEGLLFSDVLMKKLND